MHGRGHARPFLRTVSVPFRGKPSLRMDIRYILAKQAPLTPNMGQTGLDGSILVSPGVRAGLG